MTASLRGLELAPGYRTGVNDLINEFYIPCLDVAVVYDRAVGYFRSTLYVLIGIAISKFAQRGGKIRLVCSPHLFTEDVTAIEEGEAARHDEVLRKTLEAVLANPTDHLVVRLLSTLLAVNALDLRLASRPGATGIFHDKVGIFGDDTGNRVSFLGSANETFSAWSLHANHEGFEVFRDWASGSERERVDRHQRYFDTLWANREQGLNVTGLSEMSRSMLVELADPEGIDAAADKVRHAVGAVIPERRRLEGNQEGPKELQDHQKHAAESWREHGCRGIVKHATGAGKTITALNIIREWVSSAKVCIVVVPSDLLVMQWIAEAEKELRKLGVRILQVGGRGGDRDWRSLLPDYTRDDQSLGPRIVIATMQSACSPDFVGRVQIGNHVLLVADEVHRIGSRSHQAILELGAGGRLGLSATPDRYGDPEGTAAIYSYFGGILDPEFSLADALRAHRLVPYDYFVHRVALNTDEQDRWSELTSEIRMEFARSPEINGVKIFTNTCKMLLIRRAAIVKQAKGKVDLARDVLLDNYRSGDRWLVYCDSQRQLNDVLHVLQGNGLPAFEYHSQMTGSKSDTLDYFTQDGGIIVAIRCLDEGVDIPVTSAALILASSSNPREFIQRRGRVLRTSPGKYSARIHDAFVVPSDLRDSSVKEGNQIVQSEIRRALEFAQTARNTSVLFRLRALAKEFEVGSSRFESGMESEETTDESI